MPAKFIFAFFFVILINRDLIQAQDEADKYLPKPSSSPNPSQQAQINRKYGMFMHFGINTFNNKEWSDGTLDPMSYNPPEIDAEQWVSSAKKAGMKYVILITKHHDGFCLWDSKYTTYDIGSSGNKTNVVEAVAKACKKYDMGLGLYYSIWDRHQNPKTSDVSLDSAYNAYMIKQLKELLDIAYYCTTGLPSFAEIRNFVVLFTFSPR
jgi:alpha-L-fucosidase